jgi:hypothetical protein
MFIKPPVLPSIVVVTGLVVLLLILAACGSRSDGTNGTKGKCDPAYPTVCIPSPPPDLDCGDISHRRFKVLRPDPHGFDRDRDGIGCESG